MFPWSLYPMMFYPILPTDNDRPPTLYALCNSIVNYGKDINDKTKIKELAENARETIFDFDYPLSNKVNKVDFEIMILNHFLMRRIGYETFTSWQIALNVKLNEIMPFYNKILDSINEWDLLNGGEEITRSTTTLNNDTTSGNNSVTSTAQGSNTNVSDRRYSDTPENALSDVRDGTYVNQYDYDTDNNTSSSSTTSNGQNSSSSTGNEQVSESIKRTPLDKVNIYNSYLEKCQKVYTMIFKDLECLFYQLV